MRRRLETSARGLRAAQVLQDSNVLQIRVDGGAGALVDSRADSTRCRQQLREMRARMHEVQTVAQKQAVELSELRKNLPNSSKKALPHTTALEVLCPASTANLVTESDPTHTPSTQDQHSVVHAASSSICLDHHPVRQCQDDEHSLDGDSSPVNVEPCHNHLVGASASEHGEGPGHQRDKHACETTTGGTRRVVSPEAEVGRHCAPATSTAVRAHGSGAGKQSAVVASAGPSLSLIHI